MIKYFLFFILHFNLIYSYEKYILPIGIFYNTIKLIIQLNIIIIL